MRVYSLFAGQQDVQHSACLLPPHPSNWLHTGTVLMQHKMYVCMYCMYCVHMHTKFTYVCTVHMYTVGTYVCICIQNFIVHTSMYIRTCVEVADEHVMLTGQFAMY